MSEPDKCPGCGADFQRTEPIGGFNNSGLYTIFACETRKFGNDVVETSYACLSRQLEQAIKQRAEEVRQFNDGYEAAKAGLPEEPPLYERDHDVWKIGYAWFAYPRLKEQLAAIRKALSDDDMANHVARQCHDKLHSDLACSTCGNSHRRN